MTRTAEASPPSVTTAWEELRAVVRAGTPLPSLDPAEYAAGHALFEARSGQRSHLTTWLVQRLAAWSQRPSRVLSIGCGDGTVDARVAAALASGGHPVHYVGVEPHPPSAEAFETRVGGVANVEVGVLPSDFRDARPTGSYDVVLAVHSLYYVRSLAGTLARAHALLAPGGVLVVLHAPCGPLNQLVRLLAPGRRQEFSDQVAVELERLGVRPEISRLDDRLDLTGTGDAVLDRRLLEFAVQARLSPALQRAVRAALAEQALPGPGTVVSHPVDALVAGAVAGTP